MAIFFLNKSAKNLKNFLYILQKFSFTGEERPLPRKERCFPLLRNTSWLLFGIRLRLGDGTSLFVFGNQVGNQIEKHHSGTDGNKAVRHVENGKVNKITMNVLQSSVTNNKKN